MKLGIWNALDWKTAGVRLTALTLVCLAACQASSAPVPYEPRTSNALINDFVTQVQRRDEAAVAEKIALFETITGRYPQFKTAGQYLAWIEGCSVVRVAQKGTDAADKTVYVDSTLSSGPRATRIVEYVYWIDWACPRGEFRQALNADFRAPKVMVSEMIAATEEPNPRRAFSGLP